MKHVITRGTAVAVILADVFFILGDLVPRSVSIPVGLVVLVVVGGWLVWDVRRSHRSSEATASPADPDFLVTLDKVARAQDALVEEASSRWVRYRRSLEKGGDQG